MDNITFFLREKSDWSKVAAAFEKAAGVSTGTVRLRHEVDYDWSEALDSDPWTLVLCHSFEIGDLLFQGAIIFGGDRLGTEEEFFRALAAELDADVLVATTDNICRRYDAVEGIAELIRIEYPEFYGLQGPRIL